MPPFRYYRQKLAFIINIVSNCKFLLSVLFLVPLVFIATMESGDESSLRIEYVLVEEGHYQGSAFLRYAANEVYDSFQHTLTVKKWAELLSLPRNGYMANDLTRLIRECPYKAVFFETKGVSPNNAPTKEFEFVLVDAPSLYRFAEPKPNPSAFAEHLNRLPPNAAGITFKNLGGDATLVVPQQISDQFDSATYSHLAAFLRKATQDQASEIWLMVAKTYNAILENKSASTVWLSTSGMGIAWLHFRLDSQPKYYQYRPFANEV